jgi:hypothetical protein
MTVYVLKSGDCADRDLVYGVFSTAAAAGAARVRCMSELDQMSWPGSVQVEAFELDDLTKVLQAEADLAEPA